MKPEELIKQFKCGSNGQSKYYNIYYNYYQDDCVIAYSVNDLGIFILMRGERKYFHLVSLKLPYSYFGGYGYNMKVDDNISFIQLNNVVVVNKEEYQKYKDKLFLKKL